MHAYHKENQNNKCGSEIRDKNTKKYKRGYDDSGISWDIALPKITIRREVKMNMARKRRMMAR